MDSYPIPRIDDCIDKIGPAKFVSKFDLLKGYWQVPLTERAKRVSAFVTPKGLTFVPIQSHAFWYKMPLLPSNGL